MEAIGLPGFQAVDIQQRIGQALDALGGALSDVQHGAQRGVFFSGSMLSSTSRLETTFASGERRSW